MDKMKLKQRVCSAIDASAGKIAAYADSVAKSELGFKENSTAEKLAAVFAELGIKYQTGLAITGVKGRVHGGKGTNNRHSW